MSLLSVLNTGAKGLAASQLEIDVTSQNISNADVDGYSRKKVDLTAANQSDTTFGQIGTGVDTVGIERLRDYFIDDQIRDQTQGQGVLQQQSTVLSSMESLFNEPSDSGLQEGLNKFFSDWQNLANNPENTATRTSLKTDAVALTDQFHSMSSQLGDLDNRQNNQITQTVTQINGLLQQISDLNKTIGAVQQDSTDKANDSLDQRDTLLTQLSGLINITVTENGNGQVSVSSGGTELVSPLDCNKLETYSNSASETAGSEDAKVSIRLAGTQTAYVPQGGQLKGIIDNRDTIIPGYQAQLDALAKGLATGVNALHKQGYTLNNTSGISFFSDATTGASDIALSTAVGDDVNNIAAAGGGSSLAAVANTLAAGSHTFGSAAVQLYQDPMTTPPVPATNIVSGSVTVTAGTTPLSDGVDYHVDYANGTIQMLSAGYDAAALTVNFNYQAGGSKGPGDNSTALAIANLSNEPSMKPDPLGNPTATFTDYYSSTIAQLGSDSSTASSQLDARKSLITQFQTQQSSVSGVSLDEEMSNLIKYQHTYQASAQIISITGKMLDTLMNI